MAPPTRTPFLSRLIGLYCLLVGLFIMSHKQPTAKGITALLQNPSLTLLRGFITLGASPAMVPAHNLCWSGPLALSFFLGQLHCQHFFYDCAAVSTSPSALS
jgi:hypothetical protein